MSSLLILTVGTGTTGRHSNLAQGLVNTLCQLRPRLFWLVPSASPDSVENAKLVIEGAPAGCAFQPWSSTQAFRQIAQHDDLFVCRAALREVIQRARQQLIQGEELIVNPTSGTKQMSVAATLAALDEGIGEIVFTVGERADGVVKTGTERMAAFSTRQFFLERDLRMAGELFAAGAFFAAAEILKPYTEPEAFQAREKALCLHEWQRLNHAKAASHAAKFSEELRSHLKHLADADEFSVIKLGDLLVSADELARWGDREEALARYYRAAEQTAKVRLSEGYNVRPPYRRDDLLAIINRATNPVLFRELEVGRAEVYLTLRRSWDILAAAGDAMARVYLADQTLQDGLQRRNEGLYGHGQDPVAAHDVQDVADRLRNLLREHLPGALACWSTVHRPRTLVPATHVTS